MEYGYALSSERFELAGGEEKPRYGGITCCWAPSEDEGAKIVHRIWPNAAVGGDLGYELPLPKHFEEAAENVTPEDLKKLLPVGPDPDRYVEQIRAYEQAGFTHVYFNQIGREQDGFFRFWREALQPRL